MGPILGDARRNAAPSSQVHAVEPFDRIATEIRRTEALRVEKFLLRSGAEAAAA